MAWQVTTQGVANQSLAFYLVRDSLRRVTYHE